MSDPTKGGRGQKAPYQTTHYRIPEPIKPVVEQLALAYKRLVVNGVDPKKLLDSVHEAISTGYYPQRHQQPKDLERMLEEIRERNEELISSRYQANQALAEAKREIKELKAQSADAVLARYLDEIGGIPTDERGKPKARYDQLAKFKSWLESQ